MYSRSSLTRSLVLGSGFERGMISTPAMRTAVATGAELSVAEGRAATRGGLRGLEAVDATVSFFWVEAFLRAPVVLALLREAALFVLGEAVVFLAEARRLAEDFLVTVFAPARRAVAFPVLLVLDCVALRLDTAPHHRSSAHISFGKGRKPRAQ